MNITSFPSGFMVRNRLRRLSIALAISGAPLLAITLAAPSAFGQASSSSDAVGKVTDPTGASVPGATVHLVNNGTGSERMATTNEAGEWSIPNLPPANYRIRIEKQGFNASEIKSLEVEIGKTANAPVQLTAVGAISQTVEVSTLPAQLPELQEATIGQVIDQKQITDLPLNGRNVLQLATLAPGVSPAQTGQTGSPGRFGTRSLFITVRWWPRQLHQRYVLDGTLRPLGPLQQHVVPA